MALTDRLRDRTPGGKMAIVLLIGALLSVPLFSIYLLNWDRQNQSEIAQASIVAGWGGPQVVAGPMLVIPYYARTSETVEEGGKQVVKTSNVQQELRLSPEMAKIDTQIAPSKRGRSIYEAVVYEAAMRGTATYSLPDDLGRIGVTAADLLFDRAELRFGLSDARGLFGAPPVVKVAGQALKLQPGHGTGATKGSGFFAWIDASALKSGPLATEFAYQFRGSESLTLVPRAGDTEWRVTSPWASPSFVGSFLPTARDVSAKGFTASWRVGNLALGQSLVNASDDPVTAPGDGYSMAADRDAPSSGAASAGVSLVQPVDLYSQVNRATKYGFLFIGFTFLTFLMFDVIAGVRVAGVEYLLVGAGLVLFFVLLLAFAEVVGFLPAYLIASAAIIGLITAYSAAILKSRRRAGIVAAQLVALYAMLYILLSLEAYSLLIGSLMLFAALAGVMYATRNLDWSGSRRTDALDQN